MQHVHHTTLGMATLQGNEHFAMWTVRCLEPTMSYNVPLCVNMCCSLLHSVSCWSCTCMLCARPPDFIEHPGTGVIHVSSVKWHAQSQVSRLPSRLWRCLSHLPIDLANYTNMRLNTQKLATQIALLLVCILLVCTYFKWLLILPIAAHAACSILLQRTAELV